MRLHSFISTNSVLCVYTAVKKVQHLKLSLWRSIDDDHPLFGIHSFCRGNLEEGRQPAFNQKKKIPRNLHLCFQFLSVKWQQVDRWHWQVIIEIQNFTSCPSLTLIEAPAKCDRCLMCWPCFPMMAPTASAGMNRWTVSDSWGPCWVQTC